MKEKAKRQGPLKVGLPFDEAIKRALKVPPPPEGWAAYEAKLKRERVRTRQNQKPK